MSVFQEQVAEQEKALMRAEREKVALEQDKTRLSGLLNTEKGETNRLQALSEQQAAEITELERKLSAALSGSDERAELVRAKEETEGALRLSEAAHGDLLLVAAERQDRIEALEVENGMLRQSEKDLEKEVVPMRALVQALKDRRDADQRMMVEEQKLAD